jgi:hypothetical protein
MPFDILRLESPTHAIHTKRTHSKGVVTLAQNSVKYLEKSFILLVGVEEAHTPRMWVEVDERGDHASMVPFYFHFSIVFISLLLLYFFFKNKKREGGGEFEERYPFLVI